MPPGRAESRKQVVSVVTPVRTGGPSPEWVREMGWCWGAFGLGWSAVQRSRVSGPTHLDLTGWPHPMHDHLSG